MGNKPSKWFGLFIFVLFGLPYYSVPYFGGDFSLLHFTLCKSTLFGDVTPENNCSGEK